MVLRLVVVLVLALSLSACGGDDEESPAGGEATPAATTPAESPEGTSVPTADAGQKLFVANCGSCHTLADAGTDGSVGPNLDDLKPSADEVDRAMRAGPGVMPVFTDQLSDEEIGQVAEYVATAAGG